MSTSSSLNLPGLYELRRALPTPAPWAIFEASWKVLSPELFSVVTRWCRDVVDASSEVQRSQARKQIVEMFRHAGRNRPDLITSTSVYQALFACTEEGDIESAYAVLSEAMPIPNVVQAGHVAAYLSVLRRARSWHDALDAGEEIAALCASERIWSTDIRSAFDAFSEAQAPMSAELTVFFATEVPMLERYVGVGCSQPPKEPSTALNLEQYGWGLRQPNAFRGSLLPQIGRAEIEAAIQLSRVEELAVALQKWKGLIAAEASSLTAATLARDWKQAERSHWLFHNKDNIADNAEMYHFLIVGLRSHPPSLLRTLERMHDAGMVPLDASILEGVCAAEDESTRRHFMDWFTRLEKERAAHERDRLKLGHPNCSLQAMWQYDLGANLTFQNGMRPAQFVTELGSRLGVESALKLACDPGISISTALAQSPALSKAVGAVLEHRATVSGADYALDDLARVCPTLDLAMFGDIPAFLDFVPTRDFAVSVCELRRCMLAFVQRYPRVCVVDSSFIEAHENWLASRAPDLGLVIPMSTLTDLAATATDASATPDERLRAHSGLTSIRGALSDQQKAVEILFFSEMLVLSKPRADTNRRFVEIAANLQLLLGRGVCVCAEDPQLLLLCSQNGLPTFSTIDSSTSVTVDVDPADVPRAVEHGVHLAETGWVESLTRESDGQPQRDVFAEFGFHDKPISTTLEHAVSKREASRHTGRHIRMGNGTLDRSRINVNDPRNAHWLEKML